MLPRDWPESGGTCRLLSIRRSCVLLTERIPSVFVSRSLFVIHPSHTHRFRFYSFILPLFHIFIARITRPSFRACLQYRRPTAEIHRPWPSVPDPPSEGRKDHRLIERFVTSADHIRTMLFATFAMPIDQLELPRDCRLSE